MNWARIIAAAIGLIYTVYLLWRSYGDLMFVEEKSINGLRRHAALTTCIMFLGGTVTQTAFLVTGVIAVERKTSITANDYIFTVAAVISTILSYVLFHRRRAILEMLHEQNINKDREVN